MQTSLARRRRHRRNGGRPKGGAASKVAIALPLFLFGTFVLLGLVGATAAVAGYGYYSQGLQDPRDLLKNLDFAEETQVFDRTGKIELARFGQVKRDVVEYDQIPPWLIDATTAVEDKTFWDNAGFDPLGIVSAAIDSAPRQRARRIHDHPAARARRGSSRRAPSKAAAMSARSARSSSRSG